MNDWRREYAVLASTRAYAGRVERAHALLRQAAAHGPLVVSSSWGKDSVALCDLAIETLGMIDIMHLASPYELPGGERVVEHFSARARVHTLTPTKTLDEYIAWLQEVGLGYERDDQKVVNRTKTDRATTWALESGFAAQALGLRTEESKARRQLRAIKGAIFTRKMGLVQVMPLADWSVKDVWSRIVSRDLPYHRLYDCETHGQTRETLRNSGWLTTIDAGEGRIAWLRQHYPEQYRLLSAHFPRVRLLG